MSRSIIYTITAILLISLACAAWASGPIPSIGAEEIQMGKEAAVEAEKNCVMVKDAEMIARVQRIGRSLADAANAQELPAGYGCPTLTKFDYTFKVIDSDDINAFSIPGGHIYVYKGLINACETDHELAGVLAHEIAHAAHHHMVYLLKEQSRIEGKTAIILVASLLGNMRSGDMSNVMMGAQYYKTGKISGFGQKAERDADLTAIDYLIQAGYNPVGMLTFLERLADHPDLVNWGILQTHPHPWERVEAVKSNIEARGIEINRRAVTTSNSARVAKSGDNKAGAYEVSVGQRFICKLKQESSAKAAAERINDLLDKGLQIREVKVSENAVIARNQVIIEITDEDAALNGEPAAQIASEANGALKCILMKQMIADIRVR
ncbi:MAG: M48 family metalloprotease [Armatimonadota bacterium]